MAMAEQRTEVAAGDKRIPVLDGVRGIAIAMVMLFHFDFLYHLHFTAADASLPLLDELVSKTLGAGWSGVDLFFVLSGFLITGILYDAKGPARRFFGSFYARRALRIFPAYYGFLALLVIALPLVGEPDPSHRIAAALPWYGSYLTNIREAIDPGIRGDVLFVGHIWSVAVEEQFYLLWPAFVFLFSRRTLLWVCAAGVVLALALRVSFELADLPFRPGVHADAGAHGRAGYRGVHRARRSERRRPFDAALIRAAGRGGVRRSRRATGRAQRRLFATRCLGADGGL